MRPHVALVVEDDADFRESLALLLEKESFTVVQAGTLASARKVLKEQRIDVVFTDLGLPDGDGFELIAQTEEIVERRVTRRPSDSEETPDFVVITGNATLETAVGALRHGVLDFLTKPIERRRLRAILGHVVRTRDLRRQIEHLRGELRDLGRFGSLVGKSPAMQKVYDLITRVAPTKATVLVLGESGTGKELVAQTVHELSPRRKAAFIAVNCGAIAPSMIESELFGHEKGSFTGAERRRKGYFEEASGGTIFLDEITEMPFDLQVRLLRVLELGEVVPVGSSEPVPVDLRVIAASNRDPQQAVRDGRLREDLFYRLDVFPISLPPLHERGDDVAMLASHFLQSYNEREGTSKTWLPAALGGLSAYRWPGNVRELKNFVERAAILSGDRVHDHGLPERGSSLPASDGTSIRVPLGAPLEQVERIVILAMLEQLDGDKKETAARLGISLKTLYNRLNEYNMIGSGQAAAEPDGDVPASHTPEDSDDPPQLLDSSPSGRFGM